LTAHSRTPGLPGESAYCASKGGVRLLTKSVALHCARRGYGIRCNSVMPGYIATPRITDRLRRSNPADYEHKLDERRKAVPSGQLGTAWDVAYGVLYLASDESRFVNATELIIDGGQTASTTGKVWED